MNRRALSVLLGLSATLGFAAACSSSEEAAPTRTVTPAPTGGGVDSGAPPETPDASTCFEGEPASNEQFYNKCTDGQCEPFDNVARLPLFERGKPLPPIP